MQEAWNTAMRVAQGCQSALMYASWTRAGRGGEESTTASVRSLWGDARRRALGGGT